MAARSELEQDELVFNPKKTSTGFFQDILESPIDLVIAAILGLIVVSTAFFIGSLAAMAAVAVAIFIYWRTPTGRRFQVVIWAIASVLLGMLGGWSERSAAFLREQGKRGKGTRFSVPFSIGYIQGDNPNEPPLGIIYNKRRGTFSFVLVGTGSPLISMSYQAQRQWIARLAEVQKSLALEYKFKIGISYLVRHRPLNRLSLLADVFESSHEDVGMALSNIESVLALDPASLTDRQRRAANIAISTLSDVDELVDEEEDILMATIFTIKRTGKDPLAKAMRKGLVEVARSKASRRLPILRLASAARAALRNLGVSNVGSMDDEEIGRFFHEAYDVRDIQEHYTQVVEENPDNNRKHLPKKYVRSYRDCVDIDGTLHATVLFTEQPEWSTPTQFGFIDSIRMSPTEEEPDRYVRNLSRATIGTSRSSSGEYFASGMMKNFTSALRETIEVRERAKHAKRDAEQAARDEVAAYTTVLQNYYVIVDVAVAREGGLTDKYAFTDAKEKLDEAVEAVIATAKAAQLGPRRIRGRVRQYSASMTATTGIDLL